MSKFSLPFGIQSYCFREVTDNAIVASHLNTLGIDQIEICGRHANFDDFKSWKDIVSLYRDHDISIISIGVQTFQGADNEQGWFECAALAGAKHISAHLRFDSYLTTIPKIQAWSRKYGIRVGLHCHGGYIFGGSPDVLHHLIDLGSPEIGLCLDTAWVMQLGPQSGNPVEWVKKFHKNIYGLHFKDFVFDRNGQWHDTIIGEGTLDLRAFCAALETSDFDGMAVLEYEATPENVMPALLHSIKALKRVMSVNEE